MRQPKIMAGVGLFLLLACAAVAYNLRQPPAPLPKFNADRAMLAIYGVNNARFHGVLLPLSQTPSWNLKHANARLTPLVLATFRQGSALHGVIAIQHQAMLDGVVEDSHATDVGISVYVFGFNGQQWVLQKGKNQVARAGTFGVAPAGRLIRLGENKYGLWFEGSDTNQGERALYAFIVGLSESTISQIMQLDLGGDNLGGCNASLDSRPALTVGCWQRRTQVLFLKHPGMAYYPIRVETSATQPGQTGQPSTRQDSTVWRYHPSGYQLVAPEPYLNDPVIAPSPNSSSGAVQRALPQARP